MELVLGIDLGTSCFKLGLFDRLGHLRGLGRVPVEPDEGAEIGRCELPVERFWAHLRTGLARALEQAGARASSIRAISYASQANSFLLLDNSARPLTPLILWPDRRADPVDPAVQTLWNRDDFLDTTGFRLASPEFCVAKLRWFQVHEPGMWDRAACVMTISDYLTFGLTDEAIGDEATASLLGLYHLRRHAWWDVALDSLGLRRMNLSSLLRPGSRGGQVSALGAQRLGVDPGLPFAVGTLDHHAAALGAGIGIAAPMSESTGTVLAVVRLTPDYAPSPDYCTGPDASCAGYFRLAFNGNGASVLEWYRRTHAPQHSVVELLRLAGHVPPGCDGLLARPCANTFNGLEGFMNAYGHPGHGHYARAILESTASSLSGLVAAASPEGPPDRIAATGGGAASDLWLQIKAAKLGIPVIASACREPACLGAALFAATATRWFPGLREAAGAMLSPTRAFVPDSAPQEHNPI